MRHPDRYLYDAVDVYGERGLTGRRRGQPGPSRGSPGAPRAVAEREPDPGGDPEELVGTERGQFALSWLLEQDGVATLDTWAAHVAAWEEDLSLADVPRNRELHYHAWLYFAFVPCLEEEGLVDCDGDVVELKVSASRLEEYRRQMS